MGAHAEAAIGHEHEAAARVQRVCMGRAQIHTAREPSAEPTADEAPPPRCHCAVGTMMRLCDEWSDAGLCVNRRVPLERVVYIRGRDPRESRAIKSCETTSGPTS